MDESLSWRMTIVGGTDNGKEYVFPADGHVLVGRSRDVQLRISKLDGDVSRHHVEFSLEAGLPVVRNVSDNPMTRVNGVDLSPGEQATVAKDFEVALGDMVRIRLDEIPVAAAETQTGPNDEGETEATNCSCTAETHWRGAGETFDEPTEVVDHSSLTETDLHSSEESSVPVAVPTQPLDDFGAKAFDSDAEAGNDETDAQEPNSESNTTAPDDPVTPVIDPKVLDDIRREMDRRRLMRRLLVGFSLGVVALCLAGLWYFSRNTRETDLVSIKDAAERFSIRDGAGNKLLEVDYPAAPKRSVTPASDGTGVTVISYQGRDRDVPFFLQLETLTHPDELKIDLLTSVRRWMRRAAASGEGIVFDECLRDEIKVQFVEDAYPESCEAESLYGVRFVEFEYKRTWSDNKVWHGCAIYLRLGDSVYLLRREIPEELWDRGGYRLKADPNLAVYANFASAYWESPGENLMPVDRKTSDLMEEVRSALGKERAADWRFVRRDIDALLARSWRTDHKTRDLAMSFLRQFRDRMAHFYWKEYNALQVAKETAEREPKMARRMLCIRQDVQMIFDSDMERYFFLARDPEVW